MTVIDVDLEMAFSFWAQLYERTTEPGEVNLFHIDRSTGQRYTAWASLDVDDNLGRLADPLLQWAGRGDIWYGVATRKSRLDHGRRGGVADCQGIPAFWLDIDVASEAHKLPNLPQSYEEARLLTRLFPLSPSMVVRSGYGIQCYWLLTESLAGQEAIDLLARWQATWERLADAQQVHLDNTANFDRVMRVPGTYNHKGPEPVKVTYKARPVWYEVSQIADELDVLPVAEERKRTSTTHLAGSRFNELVHPQVILEQAGLTLRTTDAGGNEHWHHPLAGNETSCTIYAEDNHTTVWSETMGRIYGIELRRPFDPYGLWTWLVHGGNFVASHLWLVEHNIKDLEPRLPPADAARGHRQEVKPSRLHLVKASSVIPKRVQWLWPSWLPAGKLVIFDGDPDAGKSTLTIDLVAKITQGWPMPDQDAGLAPAGVIMMSGEDDLDDTTSWRLMAARADLDRVTHLECGLDDTGEEHPLTIPRDLHLLPDVITQTGSVLLIIDVLNEYLDPNVDGYRDQDVRRTLRQVRAVARKTGAAILMLRHLRKEGSTKALYRGGGSIGIIGAARAGWTVANHPEDESLRVLAPTKMNIGIRPQPISFKLMPHPTYDAAYIDWRGPVEGMTADQLLDPGPRDSEERQERKTQVEKAVEAIKVLLPPGRENAMYSHDLQRFVIKQTGVGERTYKSAHSQVSFGICWRERLPNGDLAMKVWRPYESDGE